MLQKSSSFGRLAVMTVLSLLIVACTGGQDAWPGISGTEGNSDILVGFKRTVVRLSENEDVIWRYNGEDDTDFYTQPTLVDNIVYAGDYRGRVHAIDYETGDRIWMYEPEQTEILFISVGRRDRVLAPVSTGAGLVFFGDEYGVNALQREGNEAGLVWEFEAEHGVWSKPLYLDEDTVVNDLCVDDLINWEDNWNIPPTLFAASLDRHLYAIDPETGDERWSIDLGGAIPGNLTLDCLNERFYLGTLNKQVIAVDLLTGEVVDEYDTEGWVWGSPVIYIDNEGQRLLYFGDLSGYLYEVVLDDESGFSNESWRRQLSEEPLRASPLIVENRETGNNVLVIGSEDRNIYAVELEPGASWIKDRERGRLWTRELDGRAMTELTWVDRETGSGEIERLVIAGSDDDGQVVVALRLSDGGERAWGYEYEN